MTDLPIVAALPPAPTAVDVCGAIANLMRATDPDSPAYEGIRRAYGVALGVAGFVGIPGSRCCDSHNRHCEPPADLCCPDCTEKAHDTFPTRHADGSRCVVEDR